VPTENTFHHSLKRAKAAIAKREPPPRDKRFIGLELVARLVAMAQREGEHAFAMLYLVSYVFLLRVPSEGLPIVVGTNGDADRELALGVHSCFSFVGDDIVLKLARRKNKPHGWTGRAKCWCSKGGAHKACCPVHELGMTVARQVGSSPFAHISPGLALATLRRHLTALDVEHALTYRLHDFRRGHARDIAASGGTLYDILVAGGWSGPAFMTYMNIQELERDNRITAHERDQVLEAQLDHSDSEAEPEGE
jgi:hypothetical protein